MGLIYKVIKKNVDILLMFKAKHSVFQIFDVPVNVNNTSYTLCLTLKMKELCTNRLNVFQQGYLRQ